MRLLGWLVIFAGFIISAPPLGLVEPTFFSSAVFIISGGAIVQGGFRLWDGRGQARTTFRSEQWKIESE